MTTWNSRGFLPVLAFVLLAGCEDGQTPAFLSGLGQSGPKSAGLSEAVMADGAVTLVPPTGFCIDKRSLKQRFALLARCDTLSGSSPAYGAPVGIITVSLTPLDPASALPSPEQTAQAADLGAVADPVARKDRITFRASGDAPLKGLSQDHWRGTARIGDQVLSVALYGPEDGRAITGEGRDIVVDLIRASRAGA